MTDYSEILRVLSRLPQLLKARRQADGLSLRAAAREIGISASTLARAETYAGYLDAINIDAALHWLDKRDRLADERAEDSDVRPAGRARGASQ